MNKKISGLSSVVILLGALPAWALPTGKTLEAVGAKLRTNEMAKLTNRYDEIMGKKLTSEAGQAAQHPNGNSAFLEYGGSRTRVNMKSEKGTASFEVDGGSKSTVVKGPDSQTFTLKREKDGGSVTQNVQMVDDQPVFAFTERVTQKLPDKGDHLVGKITYDSQTKTLTDVYDFKKYYGGRHHEDTSGPKKVKFDLAGAGIDKPADVVRGNPPTTYTVHTYKDGKQVRYEFTISGTQEADGSYIARSTYGPAPVIVGDLAKDVVLVPATPKVTRGKGEVAPGFGPRERRSYDPKPATLPSGGVQQ